MQFKGQRCSGGKQSKEQLTLALAANVSGTDKDCQFSLHITFIAVNLIIIEIEIN